MPVSDIDDLLSDPALAPVADALRSRVRPALRMRHAEGLGLRPDDTPLGADKLGGLADVPRSLASPLYRRRSLVLQLDLGRVHAVLPECPLPRQGLLQLLYDADGRDEPGDFSLVVVATDEPLRREPGPKFSHRARPLTLERERTLPDIHDPEIEAIEFPDDDEATYEAWFDARQALRRPPTHRLLGWPDWVQEDRLPEPPAPARGWRLLVQVDSAGDGLEWGDSGCLYVFVPDVDLAIGRLDRAHFLMQSC